MASRLLDSISAPAFDLALRYVQRGSDARAERVGERLGMLAYRADKKHRRRTIANLELAYPEWTDEQRLETAKGVFKHFGRMFAQFMRTPLRSKQNLMDQTEVIGMENLLAAEAQGKGIICVTGHFGSWEWMGHWFSASGRVLTVVQRDANQGGINDRVLKLRKHAGFEVMSRGAAARGILTCLKQRGNVGLLVDQNAGDIYVPFFGKPCGTVTGPAVFHLRTGAPIVPMFAIRLGPAKYRLEFLPELKPEPGVDPTESLTVAINKALEDVVRRYPDQWLWMHDRWKSARQQGML